MTHIVFGINLSCCVLKQILHNFCVATSSSIMQSSTTTLYMVRVEIHIVHINIMEHVNTQHVYYKCVIKNLFILCMMGT